MVELIIVIALIICNGFFAMSEMALMTSRKLRLKQMAETSRGAKVALQLSDNPDNLLSTVQVGITAIGVLTGLFGGDALGQWITSQLTGIWPTATEYARPIGFATAVALITAAQVIFGELIPKRLALTNAEHIASSVAIPLLYLSKAATPIVKVLGAINRAVLRMLGIRDDRTQAISEEEIRMLVTESHEQGVIDADERKMMNRVLSLGDRATDSTMTPRNRIVWLDADADVEENLQIMRERPFSRYPVLRNGNDNDILGLLETKNLPSSSGKGGSKLFSNLREPLYVSESTSIVRLLEILREEHQSAAIVVDEYGDVAGMVTINDILGAIVGRIDNADSTEDAQPAAILRKDGSYLLDGKMDLEDFKELVRSHNLPNETEHDFVTAAGFMIANLGRIPHVGEVFAWGNWQLEVVDLDGPRVDKLLLSEHTPASTESEETTG